MSTNSISMNKNDEVSQIKAGAAAGRHVLTQRLRNCRVKSAAANTQPESSFEQSFASLAYTYVADKAPALVDFMVGFQLVDKNEDNTQAVGLFGFKIADQWVYTPVFFLNGNLKGNELMYLKNKDTFVPLKESWVNYLIAKKPHVLGEPVEDDQKRLGVLPPSFNQLRTPPSGGKTAMYVPPRVKTWAKDGITKLAGWVTTNPGKLDRFTDLDSRLDFISFLKNDVELVKGALAIFDKYPGVKESMDTFYGKDAIRDLLLELKKEAQCGGGSKKPSVLKKTTKPAAKPVTKGVLKMSVADEPAKVEIATPDNIKTDNTELTDADREKLLRDGYLINDRRTGDEVSIAYNTQVPLALVNPDSTDVYDVLVKPGTFERCLVVHNPQSETGRTAVAVIVALSGDGKKKYENVHPTRVFVKQQEQVKSQIESYGEWYNKLPDSKTLSVGGQYVILSQLGHGTAVFEVREKLDNDQFRISWNDYVSSENGRQPEMPQVYRSEDLSYGSSKRVNSISLGNKPGMGFRSVNGTLYVPDNIKMLKVADPPTCEKCDKSEESCKCEYFRRGPSSCCDQPIRPGNIADVQMQIMQKTSELKVCTDQHEVIINRKRMSKLAGLFHLVKDHGLREKQAKRILKEAERFNGAKFRIKYSDVYSAMQGPGAPSFPGANYSSSDSVYGNIPTMEGPQTDYMEVPELSAGNTDPNIYDPTQMMDPMAMQTAQQARQQGQKEVFDTSMVSSMLKAVQQDSLVDKYLGDLVKALDRLGRILFMFYWHNDSFMNRYGKQDLPELENNLRNAFEVLGDVVIYLKQKTINGGAVEDFGSNI